MKKRKNRRNRSSRKIKHDKNLVLANRNILWILRLWVIVIVIVIASCMISTARADVVNIYDSPTYKDKVVVEYCDDNGKCDRLLMFKKDLQSDKGQATISKWVNEMMDKSK